MSKTGKKLISSAKAARYAQAIQFPAEAAAKKLIRDCPKVKKVTIEYFDGSCINVFSDELDND